MTRKTLLTLSLATVLVAGGLVVASNMGFKFVPNLVTPGVDHWLAVPYNNNYSVANDVCKDIGPTAILVGRFDSPTQIRYDWTCPWGTSFTVTSGEGLFVRVNASSTPVIVGSHDPNLTIPQGGFTVGVDNFLSIPYHTTATVANDVCAEVGNATLVSRFDTPTAIRYDWTCPWGTNFTINIGEALAVRVGGVNAGYIPAHY
jgi:hypothetical protein